MVAGRFVIFETLRDDVGIFFGDEDVADNGKTFLKSGVKRRVGK